MTLLTGDRPGTAVKHRWLGHRALNSMLAVALVGWIALAAIPVGSNRPIFWGVSGLVVGLVGLIYLLACSFLGYRPRRTVAPFRLAILAMGGLVAVQIVQMIPFADVKFDNVRGITVISDTLSLVPGMTFLALVQTLTLMMVFYLVLQVTVNQGRARRIALALYLVIAAHAAYALVALTQLGDPLLMFDKTAYLGSATGTFINRNSFATYLAFGCTMGLALTIEEAFLRRHPGRWWPLNATATLYLVGLAVIVAALISTRSRMGIFSGLCGSGLTAVLLLALRVRQGQLIGLIVAGGILMAGVGLLYSEGLLERLSRVGGSSHARFELYAQVLTMIADRPFLGFGGGSFEAAFPLYHELTLDPAVRWDYAHSTYLNLFVDYGVVMGLAPLVALIQIARMTIRRLGSHMPRTDHAAMTLGSMLTAGLHSLLDFSLEIHAVALMFVVILALGVAGRTERES